MKELSIYIHIPFCIKKCAYCTFNSYEINNFNQKKITDYFNALLFEIDSKNSVMLNRKITSIYFGGGTPSLIEPTVYENIIKKFDINKETEITFEANPGTINKENLNHIKNIGINRLSLGVQTVDDKLLKILGRIYNKADLLKSIELVSEIFANFSIDMIFGIPGQTISLLEKDLNFIKNFKPPHISYYLLTVEKGSRIYQEGIKELKDNKFEIFYSFIRNYLLSLNYEHYEISNFAYKGFKSNHNLTYWNYNEYLGFGAGACSFLNNERFINESMLEKYISGDYLFEKEVLTKNQILNEYIFLNLRKTNGINLKTFEEKFEIKLFKLLGDKLNRLIDTHYLSFDNNCIALTEKGIMVSNEIFTQLWIE